jgi:transposase-like protein
MAMKDYSEEFNADAVALYESTPEATTYKGIAADLGIARGTLRAWLLAEYMWRGADPAVPIETQRLPRVRVSRGPSTPEAAQIRMRVPESTFAQAGAKLSGWSMRLLPLPRLGASGGSRGRLGTMSCTGRKGHDVYHRERGPPSPVPADRRGQ